MLRHLSKNRGEGQILLEYTMVVGAIVVALIAMNVMIKRGIQGMIKVTADQIGNQQGAEQSFDEKGHMQSAYYSRRDSSGKGISEFLGVVNYSYDETSFSTSNTVANQGFTDDQ